MTVLAVGKDRTTGKGDGRYSTVTGYDDAPQNERHVSGTVLLVDGGGVRDRGDSADYRGVEKQVRIGLQYVRTVGYILYILVLP